MGLAHHSQAVAVKVDPEYWQFDYSLVAGINCHGSNGVTLREYPSGELTLEECKADCSQDLACQGIQVTSHGQEKPRCWVKSTIKPDRCDESTWSNVWVRVADPTPTPPTPPTHDYTLEEEKNCYGRNGVNLRIYDSGTLTLKECKADCSQDLACQGIQVTTHGQDKPKCWVKSIINIDKCARSTWSEVWLK